MDGAELVRLALDGVTVELRPLDSAGPWDALTWSARTWSATHLELQLLG